MFLTSKAITPKVTLAIVAMFLASSAKAFLLPAVQVARGGYPGGSRLASRLFSSLDIGAPDDVLNLFQKPNAVILDVRSDEEILNDGFIKTSAKNPWLQVSCTPADCPLLNVAAENMIPDKSSKCLPRKSPVLFPARVVICLCSHRPYRQLISIPCSCYRSADCDPLCLWNASCQSQRNFGKSGLHGCFERGRLP